MKKTDLGITKDDIRYVLNMLHQENKIDENEYNMALAKLATFSMQNTRKENNHGGSA